MSNGYPIIDDLMEERARLEASVSILEDRFPQLSARPTPKSRGRIVGTVAVVVLAGLLALAPIGTLTVISGALIFAYVVALGYRVPLMFRRPDSRRMVHIEEGEARAIPDTDLPIYTILVPAYREPESVGQCLSAIDRMEYPAAKLDLKLLLESDDVETIAAARAAARDYVEIVLVPPGGPRTKPKALNYGLLGARGEFVTIFDIEDVPEPLQLRRAVAAFARLGSSVACLQARLSFYNSRQNWLTKWFTLDYALWFDWYLPALVERGTAVPLGGTSNHFRRSVLIETGAWDPFNVTEDADLGIRLRRLGYGVELLDTTTFEEATSDAMNWIKQRSRWYKGYLQTWMVHLRHPVALYRELGAKSFVSFNVFVGGTPILAACNLASWTLTLLWVASKPAWIPLLFPTAIYYPGVVCFSLGNLLCVYMGLLCARETDNADLVPIAIFVPVYWLLMSLASLKAMVQMAVAPSFWEKTVHGMATGTGATPPTARLAEEA